MEKHGRERNKEITAGRNKLERNNAWAKERTNGRTNGRTHEINHDEVPN